MVLQRGLELRGLEGQIIRYSASSEHFAHLESSSETPLPESGAWKNSFVGGQSPGLGRSTSKRCFCIQKPLCAVFFLSKDPSRKPNETFSTSLALLWVIFFERIGSLPLQHFALSTSSRHLVAKDCIHQLPRWKANKSFLPLCCPTTPNLGRKCDVTSELSILLFRAR
ncbi:unnamed protein product [Pipistrellus nathusii]|uniref:Uncharacterized protein n=1 Tax=Pipistrellus nathusii TaxID=59473 RepID=A0ABP0A6V1_PIPNA